MTCDVEEHSIEKNTVDDGVIPLVHNQGLPRLLELFDKHNIKATFFFTGYYAEKSPKSLKIVKSQGHEIGCHSYSHDPKMALDLLTYKEQVREIAKAKAIIENIVGKIESFRAPGLRINNYTIEALITCGFCYDSSSSPGRFDGPFSSGFWNKLRWLKSKEGVHFINSKNPNNLNERIIEVPLTSCILPYIGTLSRISPNIMDSLRPIVFERSKRHNYPLVFDTHPNECVDILGKPVSTRRSDNFWGYIFGDLVRHRFKIRNMGKRAIELLEKEIIIAKKDNYTFKTINQIEVG